MKNFKDYLLSINLFCEVLIFRTSGSLMFFKIGVIKNFTIFTEKPCWSLSLITLYAQTCNFIKKSLTQVFSCGIYEIFKKTILKNICKRLVLKLVLSPALPFLITYSAGSNWHISFSFCMFANSRFTTVDTAIIRSNHP